MEEIIQKHPKPNIAILMATYNGERYLREQLRSLFNQSYPYFTLFIHDDGSTDGTLTIIREAMKAHDNIRVLDYESQHGACQNFLSMLHHVEADYYFLCDQDDKWDEDKVRLSLDAMRKEEHTHPHLPIIIHSDMYVVDEHLKVIDTSFFRYTGIRPDLLNDFEHSVEPFVTGCTMMLNRLSRESVVYPCDAASMHDAWITLCTLSLGGQVVLIPKPLVFYRQHGDNALGARDIKQVDLGYRVSHLQSISKAKRTHYTMLKALGYGSFTKYLKNKWRLRRLSR